MGALEGKGGAAQQIAHLKKIWTQVGEVGQVEQKKREAATSTASPKRRKV